MDTSKKINFWKISTTVLLISFILVLIFQISYAWTNPTANPSAGAGAISVSSGNVGIGVTGPDSTLSLFKTPSNTAGTTALGISYSAAGDDLWGARLSATTYDFNIDRNYSGWAATPALTIQRNSGKVGIGNTSPVGKLDVVAGATRSGSHASAPSFYITATMQTGQTGPGSGNVEFRHDNATQGIGFGYNTIYQAGTNTNQDLNLLSKGTSPITLNAYPYSTGGVGIGVSAVDSNYKLTVGSQTLANSGAKIETTSATNPAIYVANAGGGPALQIGAGGFVTETRTSDPTTPVAGQIWLRTDL